MNCSHNIRTATPDDGAFIAETHVGSWKVAYRGQLPDALLERLSVERRTQLWGETWWQQSGPKHDLLVYEADGILGFAALSPSRDDDADDSIGEVQAIYVDPDAWGVGVGRCLMEAAVASLRSAGFREATLWVLASNDRARRFYEKAGWHFDGTERVDHIGDVEVVEVRYRRAILG